MAYCTRCGTQVDGQFCPNCGAAVGTGATSASTRPMQGVSVNGASALCYLFGFLTGIVFLVVAPYNQDRRVRFNAFQSIFLSVAVVLIHVAISMLTVTLNIVSFTMGLMLGSMLHMVVSLGFLLVWLYAMWKSYQGEKVVLPVIGPMAERQASGQDTPTGTIGRAA